MRDRDESALRIVFDPARGQALVEAVPPAPSADAGELPGLDLALAEWESDSFSFSDFDRYAETLAADAAGGSFEIRLSGESCRLPSAARQVALRCQRLAGRRNAASSGELFDRVLACHRRFRDLPRPSAAAAYAHALDTWQWVLRLDPEAGLALQLAALFHEAWRLTPLTPLASTTPDTRELEDGQARRAARRGAWMTDELLAEAGLDFATRVRVHRLIAGRGRGRATADPAIGANGADGALAPDRALLDDADALSCLSLGAPVGAELALRPVSCVWLRELRLHGAVARLLETELARSGEAGAQLVIARPDLAGLAVAAQQSRTAVRQAQADGAPAGAGHRPASAAALLARKRLAAGMAGGAGIAPTRVGALLARAALLGDLAAASSRRAPLSPPAAPAVPIRRTSQPTGAGRRQPPASGRREPAPRPG